MIRRRETPRGRRLPAFLALAAAIALAAGAAAAQEPGAPPPADPAAAAPGPAAEAAADPGARPAAADPAPPFDPQAALRDYLARQTPEEKARSDAYFEGGYWLQLWSLLYGLAVAWLVLGSGLSVWLRDLAERLTRRGPLRTTLYALGYVLVTTVLFFPLTVYSGFFREHQYDLATQTFGEWMGDFAKATGVSLVLTPIFLAVLYGVFRKAPRSWWIWGAGVAIVFLVLMMLIAPVYIAPLFNEYVPLEDAAVRDPILSMARANGIETDKVYQFDASRQTTRISANVSGFLNTMRISLNDNLLERCTLPEVEAVMAHEIGHYALNHIYEMIVSFGLVLVAGFAFLRWGFDRVASGFGRKWGIRGIGDVAGLPLLGALLSIFFFVLTPINNTIIRSNEAEADLFSLNAARQPDGFAEVALKLGEYRKLDPGPVEEWIFYDHPSGRARIEMAMQWKAEQIEENDP